MRRLTLSLAYRWHMANAYLASLRCDRADVAMHLSAALRFERDLQLLDLRRRYA